MKLILANNQSKQFRAFYENLQAHVTEPFHYEPYESLLFLFDTNRSPSIEVTCLATGHSLRDYNGIYINGYLSTYELAAATAICCEALDIPYVNKELSSAPSLSKLTGCAKLASAGVRMPYTLAGTKNALLQLTNDHTANLRFPAVLKRADADRGIDNHKVVSLEDVRNLLEGHPPRSLWILQDYIENDGFYLVTYYHSKPVYAIFRSLEKRPDGNEQKSHMYKPKGGANAVLLAPEDVPKELLATATRAIQAMNRQIGSVDCIYSKEAGLTYVLEVNYNPQLVTIETFKDVRVDAFIDGISKIGHEDIDKK